MSLLTLSVVTVAGQQAEVQIDPGSSPSEVLAALGEFAGAKCGVQLDLLHEEQTLASGKTVAESGVADGSTLTLVRTTTSEAQVEANNKALIRAAKEGELQEVKRLLLQAGTDVEANDGRGWTPIHHAARHGHLAVVRYLVQEAGANANETEGDDMTPLHLAAFHGKLEVVKWLMLEARAEVNAGDYNGQRPLSMARAEVNTRNDNDETPLFAAVRHGHLEIAKHLVEVIGHALTLQNAIYKKKRDRVGTQVPSTSVSTSTSHFTISSNEEADEDHDVAGVLKAAANGDLRGIKKMVLEAGVSVNIKSRSHGSIPLHEAAKFGHFEMVKFLVSLVTKADASATINAKNRSGTTPLHWAAARGHLRVVEFLALQADVNVNAADTSGRTPLHYAAEAGHREIVEVLVLKGGADQSKTCKYGSTPLDYARKHPEIARFLRIAKFADQFGLGCLLCGGILRAVGRHRQGL